MESFIPVVFLGQKNELYLRMRICSFMSLCTRQLNMTHHFDRRCELDLTRVSINGKHVFFQRSQIFTNCCMNILLLLFIVGSSTALSTTVSSTLTSASQSFVRNGASGISYFYDAYEVTVPSAATYIFNCASGTALDTYGSLYSFPFFPQSAAVNLITSNDQGAGNDQFRITASLQPGVTYVLVATTYVASATGSYSITSSGPEMITLVPINAAQSLSE